MSLPIPSVRILAPCILILASLFPGGAILRADVIYSNFGIGDAYSSGSGLIVTNDNAAWSSVAVGFMPAANYTLASIEFVASDLIPDNAGISIGIFADNGGQPGGAPLESFTLSGPLGQFGTALPVLTVSSVLQPLLLANTEYWVGMEALGSGFVVWNQNDTSALGFSQTDGSGNWSTSTADQGVVEIDGTPATVLPSPPSLPPDLLQVVVPPVVSPPVNPVTQVSSQTPPVDLSSQTEDFLDTPEPGAWLLMASGLAAILSNAFYARRASPTRNSDPVTNVVIGR